MSGAEQLTRIRQTVTIDRRPHHDSARSKPWRSILDGSQQLDVAISNRFTPLQTDSDGVGLGRVHDVG